jgi:predicted Ser/Thr protein kinase
LIQDLEPIFNHATTLQGEERLRYLDFACQGNPATRRQIEAMLAVDEAFLAGSLLDHAVLGAPVTHIGRWRVKQQIGEGGLGLVYLAETSDDGVTIEAAVKILRPGFDGALFRDRFQQERQILASLSHPEIARFIDCGADEDGRSFLAMEYVRGVPLRAHLDAAPQTLRGKVDLFLGIARAVQYLHSSLVVHGDIKPGNVMVTLEGRTQLLDFGAARLLSQANAPGEVTRLLLTPHYASPEQKRGEGPSVASDIFSLGMLLEEVLGPDGLRDADLAAIARNCRAEEPHARYSSAGSLLEDLDRWRTGYPVHARRLTRVYALSRFVRRQWAVVTLTTALFAALATGWIASVRSAKLASAHAAESDRQRSLAQSATAAAAENAARYRRLLSQLVGASELSTAAGPEGESSAVMERGLEELIAQLRQEAAGRSPVELITAWRRLGALRCKRGEYKEGLAALRKAVEYAAAWERAEPSAYTRAVHILNRFYLLLDLRRRNGQVDGAEAAAGLASFLALPASEQRRLTDLPLVQLTLVFAGRNLGPPEREIALLRSALDHARPGLAGLVIRINAISRLIQIYHALGQREPMDPLCRQADELLIPDSDIRLACFGPNAELPEKSSGLALAIHQVGFDSQSYPRRLTVATLAANYARTLFLAGARRHARYAVALTELALSELRVIDPKGPAILALRERVARMRAALDATPATR